MNSQNLLWLLKDQAASLDDLFRAHGADSPAAGVSPPGSKTILQNMAQYNRETFIEIISRSHVDPPGEIDTDLLREFTGCIDRYMDEQAAGQPDFKKYIWLVATYLVFIAHKPLHPAGMAINGDEKIRGTDHGYFCPLKKEQMNHDNSLCRFCICKEEVGRTR